MAGYVKLFSSILGSTVWRESYPTRITWITMLALADRDGIVEASLPGLAHFAGVTLDEAQTAINTFLNEDLYSRSPEHGGRRIDPIEGGWLLLNHAKYRERLSPDDIREKDRIRKQKYRDRQRQNNAVCPVESPAKSGTKRDNPEMSEKSNIAEADSDSDSKANAKCKRQKEQHPPAQSALVGELCKHLCVTGVRNHKAIAEVLNLEVSRSSESEIDVARKLLAAWRYHSDHGGTSGFKFESPVAFFQNGAWLESADLATWLNHRKER